MTQVNTRPPSFVLFGTRVDQIPESYRRYLVNSMRKEFDFGAVAGAPDDARAQESVRPR